jgi:SAM-dependent methyltransferase
VSAPADNRDQIAYWNDRAGRNWTRYQDALDRALAPVAEQVMERAALAEGERVLDVGCGCGATTLLAAARVGRRGRVIGVDISDVMLARARERVPGAPGAPIVLVTADVAVAALPPVDVAISRFGVMFFADPVQAFRNLRSSAGRLAFACWRPAAENPWAKIAGDAVAPYVPAEPPSPPDAPGPWAFADPARVRTILEGSGWTGIEIDALDLPLRWTHTADLADAVDFFANIGPASRRLAEAELPQRARALGALGDALAPHLGADGLILPGAMWMVRARAA